MKNIQVALLLLVQGTITQATVTAAPEVVRRDIIIQVLRLWFFSCRLDWCKIFLGCWEVIRQMLRSLHGESLKYLSILLSTDVQGLGNKCKNEAWV